MRFIQSWQGRAIRPDGPSQWFPAEVPGCIQYDYGRMMGWGDINTGRNVEKYRDTEDYTWGRGILTLAVSEDLINWRVAKRIVDVRKDKRYGDMKMVAYSDSDFDFDGDDLIVVTRTADNEPSNHHDNNYVNFFRVENYMQYLA